MTEQERDEWAERLRRAVEQTIQRRQARRDARAQLDAARQAGLRRRHAAKLNRGGGGKR